MQLPFRRTDHDNQNTQSRLLLANHGGRLSSLCQEMHTMPETWQPHSPKTGIVTFHTLPMAVRKVGNGHLGTLYPGERTSEVPHYRHRLFYELDRS